MDISQPIENAISKYLNQWIEHHPFWAWIFTHPLPSLGLFLFLLFLFWGLIKAVGRGTEQIWLFLLKTPFKLLQPLLLIGYGLVQQIFNSDRRQKEEISTPLAPTPPQDRILTIVDRLHALKQEQAELLAELDRLIRSL
jgi:hypothetical protein